ncbi:MAG: hypothetical protein BWY31_04052 [Lentisphaerae bacterium ADurb.Bin242]|nr:MAG: hypothetical protein BWY31_04052 [Lentisphaerae bacterium ADurb.Bin242]
MNNVFYIAMLLLCVLITMGAFFFVFTENRNDMKWWLNIPLSFVLSLLWPVFLAALLIWLFFLAVRFIFFMGGLKDL